VNPRTTLLRVAATSGLAAVLCGMVAAPAVAADGDVDVVNTETVQVYTSPTGEVETQRVYEQLVMTGTGSVDLSNPISTDSLRNLEGFGGVDVEGGEQVTEMTVDGEEHLRSVSDFDGDLPLDVSVAYKLDGETVEPGDIVGESGELEVLYTVKNITAQPQEVSFPDGSGGTTTETVDVPIPMVGSLTTVAPESFTNVASDQANMAGDGKGGTKLSFTMTLFPPIGSDTAEFGYTADIVDGVVPRSDVSALPVNPLESPTFAAAADSYQGGTDTGARLAEGAGTIDSNLLKLRDGASELLAGLIKLRNGSEQLQAGLADEAAPGAEKLADGAGQLDDGLGRIADGANQLFDGTGQLVAGTGDLTDGTGRLADGANRLSGGLTEAGAKAPALIDGLKQVRAGLVEVDKGLVELSTTLAPKVKASPDYQRLTAGLQLMIDKIGTTSQPGRTLLFGLDQLRTKLDQEAVPAVNQMLGGVTCAQFTLDMLRTGTFVEQHPCFQALPAEAQGAIKAGFLGGAESNPVRAQLLQGLANNLNGAGSEAAPTLRFGLTSLLEDLQREDLADPGAIQALALLECGVSNTALPLCDAATPGLLQGLSQVQQGVPALVDGIAAVVGGAVGEADDTPKDETFRGGVNGLIDGVDQLSAGGDELLAGLGLLSDGAGDLADGTDQLDAGANRLAAGAGELNAGAGKLADGTAEAADGSGQLADGAGRLAEGLVDAAEGSGRLSAGLGQAADGAPKLVDGAQELSDKGTSKLVEAGEDTTQTYGQMYATMEAGAERAQVEDMAYGAPEGAAGLTAYSYVIQGEDGEATRNWARGLAGMALLGLGGGGFMLRRRLV
jgi:putative membrane protein